MAGIMALAIVAAIFWGLAFFSRRRFGVLGLALAAGALLSLLWSSDMVGIIERSNISFASISTAGLVSIGLVLAPAALLLFSGPSYGNKHGRVVGATLFAAFATTLVIEPLSSTLILDAAARSIFDTVVKYQAYIVTAGVGVALFDMLAIHTTGGHAPKAKH